ncbi:MAG: glycosyltransferase family 4 protein, partial [Cyanobacteria bacterium J06555_13]
IQYHYFKHGQALLERAHLAVALASYLIRHRPERVFCGHINLAPLVSPLCKLLGIPYTVMTYGKEVWYPLPTKEKKAIQEAQRVWTISRYSRDLACTANQIPPEKFDMLPCVVDGDVFTPGTASPELIEQYQLADHRVLMTVARLWAGDIYKGVDVTIRALPKIAQAFPEVKYVVIGRGDDQPRLAQLAVDLGVADQVVFAGFVPNDALVAHYRLADVYVMPSKEGFGIVYLEAMACGVPVIAGDHDGSADPVQDGRVGWQVPHRDPDAVAAACIEALRGEDKRCSGSWLREQTLMTFSAPALVERVQTLINKPLSA